MVNHHKNTLVFAQELHLGIHFENSCTAFFSCPTVPDPNGGRKWSRRKRLVLEARSATKCCSAINPDSTWCMTHTGGILGRYR
eukprot:3114144-Amphidinium_carterae.1